MNNNRPLITRADIANLKQISETVSLNILNPQILSAQRSDVRPLLGERLYNSIMSDDPTTEYADLLNGCDYEYNGTTYNNPGLKDVISLYAYARYIYFGGFTDTPFSFVQKENSQYSTPVSESSKKSVYIANQQEAFSIWSDVENYLLRTENELFIGFNCWNDPETPSTGGFGITFIQ